MNKFINEFKWFYKYFGSKVMGGRTSEKNLKWTISDDEERKKFLETFYEPCPPMSWLEPTNENHFLLKNKWMFWNHVITCGKLWKYHKLTFPKYVFYTMIEIYHMEDDRNYYMHPTINRNGHKNRR